MLYTHKSAIVAEQGAPRADFIKVDVEGMEAEVIRGARETIRRDHPVLVVSGYHKPDDLETLPRLIREIEPAYQCEWEADPICGEVEIVARCPDSGRPTGS